MGDPKKARKKHSTPRSPWGREQLSRELYLTGTYGLRNKRELWKTQTELSRIRKQARTLMAAPVNVRASEEQRLLESLKKIGLAESSSSLDSILGLTIENLLERRLQTVAWRRGLATSPHQARQLIVHGHIAVGNRITTVPGYIVKKEEEGTVRIAESSPIINRGATLQQG